MDRPKTFDPKKTPNQNIIKQVLFQSAVQRDICSRYDRMSFNMMKHDRGKGNMSVSVDLFYTFRHFDALLSLEFKPVSSKNVSYKMIMNLQDIEQHVERDISKLVHDTPRLLHRLQELVQAISFCRQYTYSKAGLAYLSNHSKRHEDVYINVFKKSRSEAGWTERRLETEKILGQYVKKFGGLHAVCSIFKAGRAFRVDLYFPKLVRRYSFDIFESELISIDKNILRRVYEVPTSEILYIIEQKKYNYELVKNELVRMIRVQKETAEKASKNMRGVVKRLNEESIATNIMRKKKNAEVMTASEKRELEKSNAILSYYQWERLVEEMKILPGLMGQFLVEISSFKTVLKQVLFETADEDVDGLVYTFTVVLYSPQYKYPSFHHLHKHIQLSDLRSFYFLLKVMRPDGRCKNDKLQVADILDLYPSLSQRAWKTGVLHYTDLQYMALDMYHLYRKNIMRHSVLDYEVSYYIYEDRLERKQSYTSSIHGDISRCMVSRKYPLLLSRHVLTKTPSRILFTLLTDENTLKFMIYTMNSSEIYEKVYEMKHIDNYVPFFSHMMHTGQRVQAADRLFRVFKNILLVDYYYNMNRKK